MKTKNILNNFLFLIAISFLMYSALNCSKDNTVNTQLEDLGILRTDEIGRILGGDYSDWCLKKEPVDTFTHISSFNVITVNNSIAKLMWIAAKEYHNYGFDIERKLNPDTNYMKINFVPGRGTSNDTLTYLYYDTVTSGVSNYYYRLKIIDIFGNFQYMYPGIQIINPIPQSFFGPAYPNPASYACNIPFGLKTDDTISLYFLNFPDTVFLIKKEFHRAGSYILTYDNNNNYHNIQKRLYMKSKVLMEKDSCNNFGDIQFN